MGTTLEYSFMSARRKKGAQLDKPRLVLRCLILTLTTCVKSSVLRPRCLRRLRSLTWQGLGNEFLSNIQAVDGIYHVVRVFEDTEITHVEETVDPVRDLQIIRDELIAKDLQNLARELETVSNIRGGD